MSMIHKAFLFDHTAFRTELADVLSHALKSGELAPLRTFIVANHSELSDPEEGEPLEEDWEAQVEPKDAQQYGDIALTKFYQPSEDVGLGEEWEELEEQLAEEGVGSEILLGSALGDFDPGKQGSYFQSPSEVQANLKQVETLVRRKQEMEDTIAPLLELFTSAADDGMGLYVTF